MQMYKLLREKDYSWYAIESRPLSVCWLVSASENSVCTDM